jgi:hypothetical protein
MTTDQQLREELSDFLVVANHEEKETLSRLLRMLTGHMLATEELKKKQ